MKRPLSFFLAVLIGWGSVTQPARAFAPVAVLAAPQIVTASGVGYALSAMAGVIGVTGLYFTIKDAQDNAVRIPLGPNANNQPPAPAAAPTVVGSGSGQPTQGWKFGGACGYTDGSNSGNKALCSGVYAAMGNSCSYDGGSTWVPMSSCEIPAQITCPGGYVSSGSSCVLQEPRQAQDDKTCDILVSGGQFATANDMNCPSTVDGTKLAPMLRDGKVIAYGTNSSGQPLMWEVTPGSQTYTIREYQQVQTATQTQIKTTTATVDVATSAVTSVQTSTSPGSMSSPSAATAPQVTTSADPTTATNTPTVTKDETKPADLQTCGLPGTPACVIDDTQFDGKDTFSSPRNSEINDKLDQTKTQLENSKDSKPDIKADWLPSLMPGNATACSPLVFDFTLHNRITGTLAAPNVQLDLCDKLELVRAILGYMLGVWTVWYVWRRFTTANQGA